jgi:ABC-type glutathione transport system ATPase component
MSLLIAEFPILAGTVPAWRPLADTARWRRAAPVLVMGGVHKSFGAGVRGCGAVVRVLAGASLVVGVGEVVGLAGEAGAGKSTLLLCAAGRVRPEQGSVTWHAVRAETGGAEAGGAEAGGAEAGGAETGGVGTTGAGAGVAGATGNGAAGAGAHPALYLDLRDSLQRREIARALAAEVALLLLDHATPVLLEELRGTISRSPRHRSAIVIASRSCGELARIAARVLVVCEGRVRAAGSVAGAGAAPHQRNRSAARARSAFPSALARARVRST